MTANPHESCRKCGSALLQQSKRFCIFCIYQRRGERRAKYYEKHIAMLATPTVEEHYPDNRNGGLSNEM